MSKTISVGPPAPIKPIVLARCRALELERDALRDGAVGLALASAKGDIDARDRLAALPTKLATLQFEIDLSHQAQDLAHEEDAAAQRVWRASIQTMEPEDIIFGLGKEVCPVRCMSGIGGGCVLSGGSPHAGSDCVHPIKERHYFQRGEDGRWIFRYRNDPQACRVFDAACDKLKVRKDFV